MIAPAAPLEKAVEGARKALDRWDKRADPHPEGAGLAISLRSLLAALDADKRLEEAEAALRDVRECEATTPEDTARRMRNVAKNYFLARLEVPE